MDLHRRFTLSRQSLLAVLVCMLVLYAVLAMRSYLHFSTMSVGRRPGSLGAHPLNSGKVLVSKQPTKPSSGDFSDDDTMMDAARVAGTSAAEPQATSEDEGLERLAHMEPTAAAAAPVEGDGSESWFGNPSNNNGGGAPENRDDDSAARQGAPNDGPPYRYQYSPQNLEKRRKNLREDLAGPKRPSAHPRARARACQHSQPNRKFRRTKEVVGPHAE